MAAATKERRVTPSQLEGYVNGINRFVAQLKADGMGGTATATATGTAAKRPRARSGTRNKSRASSAGGGT